MSQTLLDLKAEIKKYLNPQKQAFYPKFFKAQKGGYAEGDRFIGLTVPSARRLANQFIDLKVSDLDQLLHSTIHEERLIALLILIKNFEQGNQNDQEKIYHYYLQNTEFINNWDLVDLSAYKIVGKYLLDKPRDPLYNLANSKSLWERRIAIISTYQFIIQGEFKDALAISELLLSDKHDLIQKAVGWMLREVGKRVSEKELVNFLKKHYWKISRTTLRYAIERFPETTRRAYLQGQI